MAEYRDELAAAQARNAALERELAQAREEVAAAKGESKALVLQSKRVHLAERRKPGLIGAPPKIELSEVYKGTLSDAAIGEIVDFIRAIQKDLGTVSRLEGSLVWKSSRRRVTRALDATVQTMIHITSRDGEVIVRMEEDLAESQHASRMLAVLGGTLGSFFSGMALAINLGAPFLPLAVAPLAGALWIARRKYRSFYRHRDLGAHEFFAELIAFVRERVEKDDLSGATTE